MPGPEETERRMRVVCQVGAAVVLTEEPYPGG